MSTSGVMIRSVTDPHLAVMFFPKMIKDEAESQKQGRPIFKEVDYISIKWASDPLRQLDAPAHDKHRKRRGDSPDDSGNWETYAESFPAQWEAYKAGRDQSVNGTPIEELTSLDAPRRAELKALNILTVEALAGLEGAPLKRLGMDGRKLKEKAEAYLERAKGAAVDERHAAEMEDMRRQLAEMQAQINGTKAPTTAPAAKPGRGRPAKANSDESPEDAAARLAFKEMGEEDLVNYLRDAKRAPAAGMTYAELLDECVRVNAENRKRAA